MKCRFCHREAVAIYKLDQGCFCCPDEREHGYCIQHIIRANPLGSMELIEVLDEMELNNFYEWHNAIKNIEKIL